MRGVVRCSCQMSKRINMTSGGRVFVIYLEPSIRRGEEVYVKMENAGQFLSFTITSPY